MRTRALGKEDLSPGALHHDWEFAISGLVELLDRGFMNQEDYDGHEATVCGLQQEVSRLVSEGLPPSPRVRRWVAQLEDAFPAEMVPVPDAVRQWVDETPEGGNE